MRAIKSRITKGLMVGSLVPTCDNSGAKMVKIVSVKRAKTVKKRVPSCGVANLVMVSVKKGTKDIRKQVVPAVIVRQRKEYKRPGGMRIKFEDNAVVILKDEKGNPKGTLFKGPIAKEVAERWPAVAKISKTII
ncbi:50S ribosomal protein L14 [Candidatus Woesearchaeota archaeon]|nr:50S ribosomal protein L14 [Candidatus Woesearchaeota archaeon]